MLSAVTPTLARLQLRDLGSSGTVVGRLSAWATAGALAGTFVTGFVLVPRLSVTTSVIAVGAVVVVAGLVVGLRGAVLGATGAAVVVVAALAAGTLTAVASPPCDVESAYHCVRVDRDPERPSGRILVLDDLRHSYVDLGDPRHLEFDYTRWIGDAVDGSAPRGRPLDAVFVGGGGFTLPRWLAATRPGSRSRVLEVDGDLVDVAPGAPGPAHVARAARAGGRRPDDHARPAVRARPTWWWATPSAAARCRGTWPRGSGPARCAGSCARVACTR